MLTLIARGLSGGGIAGTLVLSKGTDEKNGSCPVWTVASRIGCSV